MPLFCVYINKFVDPIMLLCGLKPCLLTGPDTGDSSSSLLRKSVKSFPVSICSLSQKAHSNIKHVTHIVCPLMSLVETCKVSLTFRRLGHRRFQAVHVISPITVITEQQLVLNGKTHAHTIIKKKDCLWQVQAFARRYVRHSRRYHTGCRTCTRCTATDTFLPPASYSLWTANM